MVEIIDESKLVFIFREVFERFNVRIYFFFKGFGKYIGLIIFVEDEGELEKIVEYFESRGIRLEEV